MTGNRKQKTPYDPAFKPQFSFLHNMTTVSINAMSSKKNQKCPKLPHTVQDSPHYPVMSRVINKPFAQKAGSAKIVIKHTGKSFHGFFNGQENPIFFQDFFSLCITFHFWV